MSGPTHTAYRTGQNINVQVHGRRRNRFAQEIADEMTASYERADLVRTEHPFYDFTVTEVPSEDLRAENERLTAQAARDAATINALRARNTILTDAITTVEKVIERLDEHPELEDDVVHARGADGVWWDVTDTLREALAPITAN